LLDKIDKYCTRCLFLLIVFVKLIVDALNNEIYVY